MDRFSTGKQEFSPELGVKIAKFFGLDEDKTHWFLILINRVRAGSVELKNYFQNQLNLIREKRIAVQNQIKTKGELSEQDANLYYINWFHIAAHIR